MFFASRHDVVTVRGACLQGRCRGLCFLPVQSLPEGQSRGVVLMALAACPTDHSVASQSASATYATSIVTYNVGMDIPQCVAEKKGGQVAAGKKDDITAPSSDDRIYQLLSEMKTSFEVCIIITILSSCVCNSCRASSQRRLDQLELTLSVGCSCFKASCCVLSSAYFASCRNALISMLWGFICSNRGTR